MRGYRYPIEHYAGAFPTWLAPVQVRLLSITDRSADYIKDLARELENAGIRVETDLRNEKIATRSARPGKRIPYMLVVGDKEVESRQVAVRSRDEGDLGPMDVKTFVDKIQQEISDRS